MFKPRRQMFGRATRRTVYLLALMAFQLQLANLEAETAGENKEIFDVGFSAKLFSDVVVNDALAASKLWVGEILREKVGEEMGLELFVFRHPEELIPVVANHRADLVVLEPEEYLAIAEFVDLQPLLMATKDEESTFEIVLLVRRDSEIEGVDDLRGKLLLVQGSYQSSVAHMWMKSILGDQGVEVREARDVGRASQAILPVFFQQAHACVVPRDSFDLMVELNPQLGRALKVLVSSPRYARAVICMRASLIDDYKWLLEESLLELHSKPRGKQILTLFRIDRLVPFRAVDLAALAALVANHREVQ
jgi:ABC-type phosphate/phosphonate transport system substrate-binding protein